MDVNNFDPYKFHKVYTLDMDEEKAAAEFVRKYGAPPEVIREHNGQLWVGPVPEKVEKVAG